VDFRALVRDLAAQFKTRIELKQIGVRDEAKRLSGVGRCGREYCSASWLPDLRPVNLGVAKDQKLSLNPQQISGACGRLMCCLRYEHEFYVQSRRKFPKEGKILVTSKGEEKVIACDIFHERVTLRTADGDTRVVGLAELKGETGEAASAVEVEVVAPASVEDDPLDTPLDSTTASMLDTAEYEVAVLAGIDLAPRSGSEASAPLAPLAPSASGSESGSDDAGATSPDADGAPRRKRRRGRRGGRRLRAAEERRKVGDADGDADDDTDADHDLD
jgi:hypothetical protein